MTTAVIDADYIRFAVASVGERRSVKVTHKKSGREIEVPTRTSFYGHWVKKDGGKLAEINEGRETPFLWDDFEYEDVQRIEDPIEHVLHSCKAMYNSALKGVGADKGKGYLGEGKSFRDDVATILEYKGNRKDMLRPLLMPEVTEYMVKHLGCEIITDIEVDDKVIIEAYGKPDHVVVAVDKDALGCPVNVYNPNRPDEGIINCNRFGKLWVDDKGKVRGFGRLFHYFQCSYGDPVDFYSANSASEKKWGEKSAYKKMANCKNDREAFDSLVGVYKHLYPEAKTVVGWRGDDIDIDWKYMLNENWQLSRMLRTMEELDNVILATDILDKLEIDYE